MRDQPSPPLRIAAGVTIGITAGVLVHLFLERHPEIAGGDFAYVYRAAKHLAAGRDPYVSMKPDPRYGVDGPMLYLPPSMLVALPLVGLSASTASTIFFGMSAGLLAYAVTATGWWRLIALVSPPFFLSLVSVNWPPLLVASAILPAARWLVVTKPNLGAVAFAYAPRWSTVVIAAALLVSSFLWLPNWPAGWLHQLAHQQYEHNPPVLLPLGAIGLAGLLRWRTPEGRALAMFTLTPVSLFPYDYLVLWLLPRTRPQMLVLTLSAWLASPAVLGIDRGTPPGEMRIVLAVLNLGMLAPATAVVLRNRNVGAAPSWFERAVSGLPLWVRGSPA